MFRLHGTKCVIANGQSLSGEVDLREYKLVGINMPAAWDAANITFACAGPNDDQTPATAEVFDPVKDGAGTEVTVTAAAATYIALTTAQRDALDCLTRVKVRSGTVGVAVNQTAARTLELIVLKR